jgi:tetratricopeptide (TPR) repeat protein
MKNVLYLFLLIFNISLAQNAFEKGNQLYQKEKYQEAINNYESILQSGKESSELYFNLANCYYKLNKVAPAIYNYEKALVLNPNDSEIRNNLKFAQKLTIDEVKETPKVGFEKLLFNLTDTFHYDGWAKVSVFLAFLFLAFFSGYYFSSLTLYKRIFFFGMFAVGVLIIVSIISSIYQKKYTESEKPAIVFAEFTELKNEPRNTATAVVTIHEGTKVYVLESIANWKKVQLSDQTTGWIEDGAIKEIK